MDDNKLVLKSINQLLEYKFFIPSYQRGYRWNVSQVTQLLDDIWEFTQREKNGKEFYCLQPVVVKATDNDSWEVIDGQQRLTTIRIFLSYLVKEHLKRPLKEAFKKGEFSIVYQTRPTSEDFLKDPKQDYSYIDFYYMWAAYQTTVKWFSSKDYNDCNKFLSALLAKEDKENPVKVIWYEINGDVDTIDIFTRLNIGKIPLTNAELIKALFLGTANPKNQNQKANYKQLQIASEWDAIENKLQDESFWHFIYDKDNNKLPQHKYDTRIEYIFDLMKNNKGSEEKYFTFYKFLHEDFEKRLTPANLPNIEAIWLDIKKYFLTFDEWYNDRNLYHQIGFIIANNGDLKKIKDKASSSEMTKSKFKSYLQDEIAKLVDVDIEGLDYENGKDKAMIKRILLLTNIQTLLANPHSKSRFPFDSYKKGNWDIEHVRSQSEVELKGKDRIEWAKLILDFYTGVSTEGTETDTYLKVIEELPNDDDKAICNELLSLLNDETTDETFNNLYQKISAVFKEENTPNIHNISNLVLLDAGTNRAYKNAFFPIKRMEIMKKDSNGSFVPIMTKNVFVKAYSRKFDKIMYWDASDADDYLNAIKSVLDVYLNNAVQ